MRNTTSIVVLAAICGCSSGLHPAHPEMSPNVSVRLTSEGVLTERATQVAREALGDVPTGRDAEAYFDETWIDADEPGIFAWDSPAYHGAIGRIEARVQRLFGDAGYPFVRAFARAAPTTPAWEHVEVTVTVTPGPRLRFGTVTGPVAAHGLDSTQWYSQTRVRALAAPLQDAQDDAGRPKARIGLGLTRDGDRVNVSINVEPGPPGYVQSVWVDDKAVGWTVDGAALTGLTVRTPFRRATIVAARDRLARSHPDRDIVIVCRISQHFYTAEAHADLLRLDRPAEALVDLVFVMFKHGTALAQRAFPRCDTVDVYDPSHSASESGTHRELL